MNNESEAKFVDNFSGKLCACSACVIGPLLESWWDDGRKVMVLRVCLSACNLTSLWDSFL